MIEKPTLLDLPTRSISFKRNKPSHLDIYVLSSCHPKQNIEIFDPKPPFESHRILQTHIEQGYTILILYKNVFIYVIRRGIVINWAIK